MKENERCCKVYPCVGMQHLAEHVGNVCADGIIGKDSLGTRYAQSVFRRLFHYPQNGGSGYRRIILEL